MERKKEKQRNLSLSVIENVQEAGEETSREVFEQTYPRDDLGLSLSCPPLERISGTEESRENDAKLRTRTCLQLLRG